MTRRPPTGRRLTGIALALLTGALGLAGATPATAQAPVGPRPPEIVERLARSTVGAEAALRDGEWAIAESRFRGVLLEALLLRGTLDLLDERWPEAARAFEAARRAVADPRRAEIARAILAVRRGRADDALPILRSVVVRHPGDARARRLLAQVLALSDRLPEAVQELEEAHALVPDDGETTFALATAHLRLTTDGGLARAGELFERLIEERPGAATAVLVGRSYLDYRHHDEARAWLERALALDPRAVRASYYLGKLVLSSAGYEGLERAAGHFRRELEVQPGDPVSSLYLGLALAELRRCDEATAPLERATGNPLTALDAHRFLGKCHLAEGDPERDRRARDELEAALEIASESGRTRQLESVHYQLGVALRRLGDPAADEHFAAAERLSGHLVETDRANLETYLSEGLVTEPPAELLPLALEGLEALSALGPARRAELRLRIDREAARAYANLGALAMRDSRPGPATRHFEAAAGHDPSLPGLDRNLGMAAFRAQRWELAAEALTRVVASDPSGPGGDLEARRALALAHVNLDEYEAAAAVLVDDAGRAGDPSLQYAYALALVRSERTDEAAAAFERLLREHPEWAELHVLLGQAKAKAGDFPGARETLRHALGLRADVPEAWFTLGEIHLRQGELDEAIAAFEAELAHTPGALQARYQLAVALDLADRPDDALAELDAVLRQRPTFADARYLLGKVLLGQGRAEEAKSHLLAAAGESPGDPNIHYQLALAHQRLGEVDEARVELERYRELKDAERRGGDS